MAKGDWLGEFEMCVLLALEQLEPRDGYGARVRDEIFNRAGRDVAIGAVYATLARLEEKRLVVSEVGPPAPVPGGRGRKCFRLTAAGKRELAASTAMLKRMMGSSRPARAR